MEPEAEYVNVSPEVTTPGRSGFVLISCPGLGPVIAPLICVRIPSGTSTSVELSEYTLGPVWSFVIGCAPEGYLVRMTWAVGVRPARSSPPEVELTYHAYAKAPFTGVTDATMYCVVEVVCEASADGCAEPPPNTSEDESAFTFVTWPRTPPVPVVA